MQDQILRHPLYIQAKDAYREACRRHDEAFMHDTAHGRAFLADAVADAQDNLAVVYDLLAQS